MTFAVFNRLHLSIATLLISGCGSAADNGEPAAARNMPGIHLDQIAETLVDGRNAARTSYQQALSDCQAAGLPTRALDDADVARLGTVRYEAWLSSKEEVFRTREWRLLNDGPATSCQFRLEATGLQETQSASGVEQVDLATGERSQSPPTATGSPALPPKPTKAAPRRASSARATAGSLASRATCGRTRTDGSASACGRLVPAGASPRCAERLPAEPLRHCPGAGTPRRQWHPPDHAAHDGGPTL